MRVLLVFLPLLLNLTASINTPSTATSPPSGIMGIPTSASPITIDPTGKQPPAAASRVSPSSSTPDLTSNPRSPRYEDKQTRKPAAIQKTHPLVDDVTLQILQSCKVLAPLLNAVVRIYAPWKVVVIVNLLSTGLLGIDSGDMSHRWLDEMGIAVQIILPLLC